MNTICTTCKMNKENDKYKTCLKCRLARRVNKKEDDNLSVITEESNNTNNYLTKENLEELLAPLYEQLIEVKKSIAAKSITEVESIKSKSSEVSKVESIESKVESISSEISLKKFKIVDKIENKEIRIDFIHPFTCKLFGNRGTGKTTWIINYLNNIKDNNKFNEIIFITNSESQDLFKLLKVRIQFKKPDEFTDIIKYDYPVLYIFDDCMQDLRFNKNVMNIYTRGRHCNISIFSLEQHCNYSNNVERGNTDYFLLFRINDVTALDLFHKKFCSELLIEDLINMTKYCNERSLPLMITNTDPRIKYRYNFNYKLDKNLNKEKIIKELIIKQKTITERIKKERPTWIKILLVITLTYHCVESVKYKISYKRKTIDVEVFE